MRTWLWMKPACARKTPAWDESPWAQSLQGFAENTPSVPLRGSKLCSWWVCSVKDYWRVDGRLAISSLGCLHRTAAVGTDPGSCSPTVLVCFGCVAMSCHHCQASAPLWALAVRVFLLSTARIKQMINRLKKKGGDVSPVAFFDIWDPSSRRSGLFNWPKQFVDCRKPCMYIIIQKKSVSASSPFPLEGDTGGSGEQGCMSKSGQSARLHRADSSPAI